MKAIIMSLIIIISAYAVFSMFNVEKVIDNRGKQINSIVANAMK